MCRYSEYKLEVAEYVAAKCVTIVYMYQGVYSLYSFYTINYPVAKASHENILTTHQFNYDHLCMSDYVTIGI